MAFGTIPNDGISNEFREYMKDYLQKNPIDPAWDEECELFDGNPPIEQSNARVYKKLLEKYPE